MEQAIFQILKPGIKAVLTMTAFAAALLGPANPVLAQEAAVEARVSTREAYVGSPIMLEIQITNADDYQRPPVPKIDGCEVRFAGAPSHSSQITIINGVRDEKKIITLQYVITPRREGKFVIPELPVQVGNKKYVIKPQRFIATKSETGDLLFVEIEGGRDRVYVGQPLDLKLKIWIKPFRDVKNRITLSEATMWRLISRETSWGSFADRLEEMANSNQRPGGREVLRDDGDGNERAYYLYEIDATVYPKRPGRIDADDVQIIVQYPTALGRSSDPFDRFFQGNSPFRQNPSRLSNMLDDDFFGGSPFGNRIAVKSARPIVAEAQVDETEVLAVPMEGRPADYRGAVGQYQILTQATTTSVAAGDPVNLNIGIIGTGPMELVQAPPLSVLPEVTDDFKVSDAPLAGFVQDETKMFSTTLRPRNEGVTQIPAIPFSFFDPDTEEFVTVRSNPISINVTPAETLSLDGLAGGVRRLDSLENEESNPAGPNLAYVPVSFGEKGPSSVTESWPWIIIFGMPILWLMVWSLRFFTNLGNRISGPRTAKARGIRVIEQAESCSQLADAVHHYLVRKLGGHSANDVEAIGRLRSKGFYSLGTEVESFFSRCRRCTSDEPANERLKKAAVQLLESLETTLANRRKPIARKNQKKFGRSKLLRRTVTPLLIGIVWINLPQVAFGQNDNARVSEPQYPASLSQNRELSVSQQKILLDEFEVLYEQARELAPTDSVESKSRFVEAAKKGQVLADGGFRQSDHYVNLANAYLQSGQIGRAIANYELALAIHPFHENAADNLEFANSLVENSDVKNNKPIVQSGVGWPFLSDLNSQLTNWIGSRTMLLVLALASILFWGLLICRITYRRKLRLRWMIPPLVILILAATSLALHHFEPSPWNGVLVTEQAQLRSGDGAGFDEIESLDAADGQRVCVLFNRGNWFKVKTSSGNIGWLPKHSVEIYGDPLQSLQP